MKARLSLTLLFCSVVAVLTFRPVVAEENQLGIGSDAPPLDIEHWIQDGNGFFEPVTEFEDGKVYVIEFWATWCGPCIASMPHLAELQNKYRGRGVQIVSVSDESLEEVQQLLERENEEVGKTFDEITSAYTLTTDPDGSVQRDYMRAAGEQGIPTSFIVGKTGKVEWIGHPMSMDEPLEAVVNDSWDRAAFKKERQEQQQFQENYEKMARLAGTGKFEAAIELAEQQYAAATNEAIKEQWQALRYGLKLSAGQVDQDVLSFYRGQIEEMKGNAYAIGKFGFSLYQAARQGAEVGELGVDAAKAIEAELAGAEEDLKPLLYNTMAQLYEVSDQLEKAIEAQQSAIESTDNERQKSRFEAYLKELQEKAGGGDAEADAETEAEAAAE